MKLKDLFEKLTAPVHQNMEKTLFAISNLVEKEFGIPKRDGAYGTCLVAQIVFTLSSVTGISPAEVIKEFNKPSDSHGHTLDELIKYFSNIKLDVDGKTVKPKLKVETYSNIGSALHAVMNGQPVILITSADNPIYRSYFRSSAPDDGHFTTQMINDMIDRWGDIPKAKNSSYFHTYLIFGYDAKEKTVLMRDARHEYSYKGFLKVDVAVFSIKNFVGKLLSIVVDSLTEVKK